MTKQLTSCPRFARSLVDGCLAVAVCFALGCAGADNGAQTRCDEELGQSLFSQCALCHSLDPAAQGFAAGPNLHGVVGRPIGQLESFAFSPALRNADGTWTRDRLDAFLANPFGTLPGLRMAFAGMPNRGDRAALICFLVASGRD